MKKIFSCATTLLFCLGVSASLGQNLEYADFDFGKSAPVVELSETEKKEPSVILEEKRVIQYSYNEKGNLEFHYFRFKSIVLLEDKALESFNKIQLPIIDQKYLVKLGARSISPAGKIRTFSKEDIKEVEEEGNKYAILAIDGLEKNSILEYFYLVQYSNRYWGTESVQGGNYIRKETIEIWSPENLKFRAKGYFGFDNFRDTVIQDKNVLMGEQVNIPVLYNEDFSQDDANLMRVEYKMDYNSYNNIGKVFNFAQAGKNYYEAMHRDHDDCKKDVAAVAKSLKIDNLTLDGKIFAIEKYIKSTYQILDESDVDEVSKIIKNKYGTQTGINRLYAELFDYFQIKFEIVLTCSRFDKKFDPDFDSWTYLENLAFYIPDTKGYIATNNITLRYPMIHYAYTSQKAMFIKEISLGDLKSGVHTIRKIEPANSDFSHDDLRINISFDTDITAAVLDYTRTMTGYSALGVRPAYFYMKDDDRKKIVTSLIKEKEDDSKIENIKVTNFDINSDEVNKPYTIACKYTSPALLEAAGDNFIIKIGETIGRQSELYNEKPRLTPIENDFNRSYLRTITLKIPQEYTITGLERLKMNFTMPADGNKGCGFISDYTLNGDLLTVTINEYYDSISLPLSEYNNFTKVINAAADFNKISLVMKKK